MTHSLNSDINVHPTAIVDSSAELEDGVTIGPYAVVEPGARIGAGTSIGAGAYIGPWTTIGRNNRVYHHATVGSDSQSLAYRPGDETYLIVGDDNLIREYATLNRASDPGGATRVGNSNCFMACSHIAHNCIVGDHTVFANSAASGGHVVVEDYAILGGLVGIHQFCRIGRHAIVGSNSKVNMDVAPYLLVDGHPARPHGINTVGLKRRQLPPEEIRILQQAYKILFHKHRRLKDAMVDLQAQFPDSPHVKAIIRFIRESSRGILRPRKGLAL